MKVKVISRSTDNSLANEAKISRVFWNFDPSLQTQEKAVEYVRAVNAAKLDKIFARPFVGAMDGHMDAVSCMAKNPNYLKGIFSGSMDGDIRLWDIVSTQTFCQFPGHQGAVWGLTASTDGRILVSCGTDCTLRLWNVPVSTIMESDDSSDNSAKFMFGRMHSGLPIILYFSGLLITSTWDGNLFATAGAQVDIWDHNSDRSITLYALHMTSPARKLIMRTKTNSISWNPMELMYFTAANEDCNCYSYDARKLDEAKCRWGEWRKTKSLCLQQFKKILNPCLKTHCVPIYTLKPENLNLRNTNDHRLRIELQEKHQEME